MGRKPQPGKETLLVTVCPAPIGGGVYVFVSASLKASSVVPAHCMFWPWAIFGLSISVERTSTNMLD